MSINIRLKEFIEFKKLKIKDFAEISGLTYRTAQNYLSGERRPDAEGFLKLSTRLGINLNWLITGVGEPFIGGEDAATAPPAAPVLNREEAELLKRYRQASELGRAVIMSAARGAEKKEAASETRQVA